MNDRNDGPAWDLKAQPPVCFIRECSPNWATGVDRQLRDIHFWNRPIDNFQLSFSVNSSCLSTGISACFTFASRKTNNSVLFISFLMKFLQLPAKSPPPVPHQDLLSLVTDTFEAVRLVNIKNDIYSCNILKNLQNIWHAFLFCIVIQSFTVY